MRFISGVREAAVNKAVLAERGFKAAFGAARALDDFRTGYRELIRRKNIAQISERTFGVFGEKNVNQQRRRNRNTYDYNRRGGENQSVERFPKSVHLCLL